MNRIEKANLETAQRDYEQAVRRFASVERTYQQALNTLHDAVEALDRLQNPEMWPRAKRRAAALAATERQS